MDAHASRRLLRTFLLATTLLVGAFAAAAHDTIVPHHLEDVEDIAHARNVRGLALVITIAFTVVLATVVFLAMRYAPADEGSADVPEEQQRLRDALLLTAEAAKDVLGASDDELADAVAMAYGAAAGHAVPPRQGRGLDIEQRFGEDILTARRTDAEGGVELCATTATAGATVRIARDGAYSLTVFAVTTQTPLGEGSER
jgi:hypothetical protein